MMSLYKQLRFSSFSKLDFQLPYMSQQTFIFEILRPHGTRLNTRETLYTDSRYFSHISGINGSHGTNPRAHLALDAIAICFGIDFMNIDELAVFISNSIILPVRSIFP